MNKITSKDIAKKFKKTNRDIHVYELEDTFSGINIIREYLPKNPENKMFIKFALLEKNEKTYVIGSIETVKKSKKNDGWIIKKSKTTSNFNFHEDEEIIFSTKTFKINFKGKTYTINEFVSLLEKNHLRKYMFILSKLKNKIIEYYIHFLFFLIDKEWKSSYFIKQNLNHQNTSSNETIKIEGKSPDPFFKYFKIHKNLLMIMLIPIILITSYYSIVISPEYFSISNPFLLFSSLLIFFILEKFSLMLSHIILKTKYIEKLFNQTFILKGKIKKY